MIRVARRPPAPRKDSSVIRVLLPAALSLALVASALAATPGTLPHSPLLGVPGGPTLAAEDTIPLPSALLPTVFVTAPRVSLDEILRRVAEGEARRDSLMKDQSYTLLARITYLDADSKAPDEREEEARVREQGLQEGAQQGARDPAPADDRHQEEEQEGRRRRRGHRQPGDARADRVVRVRAPDARQVRLPHRRPRARRRARRLPHVVQAEVVRRRPARGPRLGRHERLRDRARGVLVPRPLAGAALAQAARLLRGRAHEDRRPVVGGLAHSRARPADVDGAPHVQTGEGADRGDRRLRRDPYDWKINQGIDDAVFAAEAKK